jgi:hypothetical protein
MKCSMVLNWTIAALSVESTPDLVSSRMIARY